MLWFFERNKESLKLETRYDAAAAEYVVIIRYADGREQSERFAKSDEFRSWLVAFERNLEAQHWNRQGPPVFLADGWPKTRLDQDT